MTGANALIVVSEVKVPVRLLLRTSPSEPLAMAALGELSADPPFRSRRARYPRCNASAMLVPCYKCYPYVAEVAALDHRTVLISKEMHACDCWHWSKANLSDCLAYQAS